MMTGNKGGVTVVMSEADYIQKAQQLSNETITYSLLDTDANAKVETKINKTPKKLRNMKTRRTTADVSKSLAFNGLSKETGGVFR